MDKHIDKRIFLPLCIYVHIAVLLIITFTIYHVKDFNIRIISNEMKTWESMFGCRLTNAFTDR
jgi:hypothetical protein